MRLSFDEKPSRRHLPGQARGQVVQFDPPGGEGVMEPTQQNRSATVEIIARWQVYDQRPGLHALRGACKFLDQTASKLYRHIVARMSIAGHPRRKLRCQDPHQV